MRKLLLLVSLALAATGAWAVYRYQDSLRQYPQVNAVLSRLPGFNSVAVPTPPPVPVATPKPLIQIKELPITLPMLDALFFVDQQFTAELKKQLQFSDEQVEKLRQLARTETQSLRESSDDEVLPSTLAAGERAAEKVSAILGAEKAGAFADFALQRWQYLGTLEGEGEVPLATATPGGTLTVPPALVAGAAGTFNAPTDSRIVVNAPAYRMDVFENGQLVKSYKAAMGVPDFPVPTGMRKASQIIFNPTWTPPDEPWVAANKVGQKVAAGDKLNPLGVIKIPIGAPLLIHGGKPLAKIGTLGSHGCVGLTDLQVQDFAKLLGRMGGVEVTDEELAKQAANRSQTKVMKLKQTIPVELRYVTILVEGGKLNIFRDIYGRATNTRENLAAVLQSFDLKLEDLSATERAQVEAAMAAFFPPDAAMASPTPGKALTAAEKAAQRKEKLAQDKLVKQYKAAKVAAIEIAALAGKGYPAPTEIDTGVVAKPATTKR